MIPKTRGQRFKRSEKRAAKHRFLQSYALQGLTAPPRTNRACQAAGISRAGLYRWLKTDPRFHAKYEALQAVYYLPWCVAIAERDADTQHFAEERKHYEKQKKVGLQLIRLYQETQENERDR